MRGNLVSASGADLRSIHDFIARDSRYYAKKVVHDIREKVEELNGFPKMGRIVPELNEETARELLLYSCRIIRRGNFCTRCGALEKKSEK